MAKYTQSELEKLNKSYKQIFKTSGCRLLSNEEMQNISDSMSVLSSSDVKIIEAAKNGEYSNLNAASPLVRNYIGTLAIKKFVKEIGVSGNQISLDNKDVKKYIQQHVLDAGFRTGLSALKQTYPENKSLKLLDEYANEYLLAKTLSATSEEGVRLLKEELGEGKASQEIIKNQAKQIVLAKTLFMAQLGKYTLQESETATEYKGSIAETFAHGGRTNFILPFNDTNNAVLAAFEGEEIGKTAEIKSRIAATHSATQRKVNMGLGIESESKEEKPSFKEVGKIFSNQYGMDIAIGGVGEVGPNKKPIVADGSAGHMYIRKQQGDENTCGSLMIGIESAASLKTSHTGHFHTPLAKSSKLSAFLSDKFGPGDKTNGKTVDLSGLEADRLATAIKEFEKGYVKLQSTNPEKLSKINELLAGKRLSKTELFTIMTGELGMQRDFAASVVEDARKGLVARVDKETANLLNQFKDVFGVDINNKMSADVIKVMRKDENNKWQMSNLFSSTDTLEQKFSKFWKSVQAGEQVYLTSKTKPSPVKINVNNRELTAGEGVGKSDMIPPKEPSGIRKTLHKLTNGLLFASSIKQYEIAMENFEKQQLINSFVDEHKIAFQQAQRQMTSQEEQLSFKQQLERHLNNHKNIEKSQKVDQPVSKEEVSIEL